MEGERPDDEVEEVTEEALEAQRQADEAEKRRSNNARVQFRKPVVKHIVSPHSGSILAEHEPVLVLDKALADRCAEAFEAVLLEAREAVIAAEAAAAAPVKGAKGAKGAAVVAEVVVEAPQGEKTLPIEMIPALLQRCGFEHDLALLSRVVEDFYVGWRQGDKGQAHGGHGGSPGVGSTVGGNGEDGAAGAGEALTLPALLDFVEKFHTPSYHYGERLRRNVGRGQADAAKTLVLRGTDANTSDGMGTSSLHYCAEFDRPEIIEILAQLGEKGKKLVVNGQDRYGWTPLHSACHQGNKTCAALLLKLGADPNLVNNVGKSPLHTAAMQNRGAIVEILLAAGANPNLPDNQGMSPIHEAAYRGQAVIYAELSKLPGADLGLKDRLGYTPPYYFDNAG
ncbi:ankyrin repeat-containing domain protein [Ochromonadaceae sp. CCMP2298]|nr:ankyrin repeat-containing domain protein [Ochromonadaceae sp. CCMP2298]